MKVAGKHCGWKLRQLRPLKKEVLQYPAEWTRTSATRTSGLKLHLLYAADDCRPVHQSITAAKREPCD
jgi:hypothetical protein